MGSEQEKGVVETAIFRDFAAKAPLPIDASTIGKRSGEREPDFTCVFTGEGIVAFELVEICDSTIAHATAVLRAGGECEALWTSDPSVEIVRRKLHKSYDTSAPVELLCYTRGRVVSPDDVILDRIRPWFDAIEGQFRRAWFLGDEVHEVWRAG